MNGYVEAGYVVILGTLGTYSISLLGRERAARRRIDEASRPAVSNPSAGAPAGQPEPTVANAEQSRAGTSP